MPDPIDQNLPQAPVTPTLPNPQDMVDAALSGVTSTPKPEVAEAPKSETLPPLTPLTPPVSEPTEPVVAPATIMPEPVVPPVAVTPVVAMGDDTPLAFAGMPSSTAPVETNTSSTSTPNTPPTGGAPLPPVVPQAPEPKKKKKGLIIGGLLFLVLAVGGVLGYNQYAQTGTIAVVGQECKYNGSTLECKPAKTPTPTKKPAPGGGSCSSGQTRCSGNSVEVCAGGDWRASNCTYGCANGACKPNPNPPPTTGGGGGATPPTPPPPGSGLFGSLNPDGTIAGTYACGNNQLCLVDSPGTLQAAAQYCQTHDCDALNFTPTVQNRIDDAITANGNSSCLPTDTGCPQTCSGLDTTNVYKYDTQEPGGGTYCNAQGEKCTRYRIEKMTSSVAAGASHCFVGYGETCGGSCGGDGTPPPSAPPSTPTMKCDGLTSVPDVTPAPVVGVKLTFTCAGTVTPTTAGTLSYKFRYSINSGTPVALTPLTATPNKAELTINACGTYKVECQACATLNGVLTCSPVWTGATQ